MRIVILGGVAGGASAAARARRLDEKASITILEKGPHVSFANCGLPYALGGVIENENELLLQTPKSLKDRFNLDVKVNCEALRIDRTSKKVVYRNLESNIDSEIFYDKLIISTGAEAFRPSFKGADLDSVFTLQSIPDLQKIELWIKEKNVKSAVVIGGGFIGLEACENLVHRAIKVSLVERVSHVFPPADADISILVNRELIRRGVNLLLNTQVKEIEELSNKKMLINIERLDGKTDRIQTDLVIMAIGVKPRSKIAKDCELKVSANGAISVDEFMRTSDLDIYAVGDVVEVQSYQSAAKIYIPLAGPANRQGRLAVDHIYGKKIPYRGTLGTSVCQIFDFTVALTGYSVKSLEKINKNYEWITVHPHDHAGYYPGANQMTLKLIFDPQAGAILGAQAIGKSGIDKRIDVLSTAIQGKLTVFDLEHLELCYAPPYSSAKDPVNMAGFVASNVLRKDVFIIHPEDLKKVLNEVLIIDVRSIKENSQGAIEGSINIPINELRDRIEELNLADNKKTIVVYCQVGFRGYLAARILTQMGFEVKNLDGGYTSWGRQN